MAAAPFHSGGSGEPMVLLHGFTNDWQCWRPVIPALEERFAVFAPTLPGHFGAEPWGDAPVSIEALTDGLERQLDSQGIGKAHFVGNSLGGWLSLELALRGRALSVTGLCPAGGWEDGSREERATYRYFRRTRRMLQVSRPFFETIASRPRMRAIAYRDMVSRPSRVSADTALAGMEAALNCGIAEGLLAASEVGPFFGELGEIDCPVTIALASKDRLFPSPGYVAKLRRLLPAVDWTVLEGLGHIPMTDDPDRVTEVILTTAATTLSPSGPPDSPIARLVAERGATMPRGDLPTRVRESSVPPAGGPASREVLDQLREERL